MPHFDHKNFPESEMIFDPEFDYLDSDALDQDDEDDFWYDEEMAAFAPGGLHGL